MSSPAENVIDSFERLSGMKFLEGHLCVLPENEDLTGPVEDRLANRLRVNRYILNNLTRSAA